MFVAYFSKSANQSLILHFGFVLIQYQLLRSNLHVFLTTVIWPEDEQCWVKVGSQPYMCD